MNNDFAQALESARARVASVRAVRHESFRALLNAYRAIQAADPGAAKESARAVFNQIVDARRVSKDELKAARADLAELEAAA